MILNGENISIQRTKRKKTLSIFIERDGSIKALVPQHISDEKIQSAIKSKEHLIFTKLAKWKELNKGKFTRQFVNGQSFLLFGRNYRLSIVEGQDVPLKLSGGFFKLDKSYLIKAEQIFKSFYKEKAKLKIEERLEFLSDKFDKKPNQIKVRELKHRWASWSPNHTLNFHWKCAMLPIAVLDYVIVHEMVHFKFPNHSKDFWNEVDKKMPNYKKYDEWLKGNGVKIDL